MNALAQHFARDRRKPLIWAVGITMAVLLAAGGALAGSALAGGSAGGSSGTAATLNAALNSAGSTASNTPAAKAHRAGAIARLRRLGGMYGEAAYRAKDGTTHTLAFERGVVTTTGGALVVKAANGTTWTWQYTSSTVVRKSGAKVSRSDLSSGERVVVAGPVVAGARDARLIVVAKTPASGSTPAPAPSASTSSSAGTSSVS